MNILIFINILISFFNFIFIAYIYLVIRDIEKDRLIAKEKQELKHLYDIKVLKEMPKKFEAKEIKEDNQ